LYCDPNRSGNPEQRTISVVRTLVAALLLVVFGFLNAIDGICCPDGCTQEEASTSQHHDRESSDGSCVLCLGGVESATPQTPLASGVVTSRRIAFEAPLVTLAGQFSPSSFAGPQLLQYAVAGIYQRLMLNLVGDSSALPTAGRPTCSQGRSMAEAAITLAERRLEIDIPRA
jgi:hypothetical protein